MKKLFFLFFTVLALASCKENEAVNPTPDPTPTPVTECWEIYDSNFDGLNIAHKFDPKTNCTYVSKCAIVSIDGEDSYVPFVQKITPDGQLAWSQWCQIQTQKGSSVIYYPDFDITSDSQTINLYSVPCDGSEDTYEARINKVTADGSLAWGDSGIKFCDFTVQAQTPTDGYVVADNNGGAWVAASNNLKELVVRHVDRDGNLGNPVLIDAKDRAIINHPRMFLNPDGGVVLVAQRSDVVSLGDDTYYNADFDLITITDDGQVTEHPRKANPSHLLSNKKVAPGTRISLMPYRDFTHCYATLRTIGTNKPGEVNDKTNDYVTSFSNTGEYFSGENSMMAYGYDTRDVTARYAINDEHSLVVIAMLNLDEDSKMFGNIVDQKGRKLLGKTGELVEVLSLNTGEKFNRSAELLQKTDGKYYQAYGVQSGSSTFALKTVNLSDSLKVQDSRTALTRDQMFVSTLMATPPIYAGGNLRMLFYNPLQKSMFGALLKVE